MIETVRARLTLWYVSILAAALIVVAALIYVLLARAMYARVDEAVVAGVQIAITSLANDFQEGQDQADAARSTVGELSSTRQMVAIYDGSGRLLAEGGRDTDLDLTLPPLPVIPQNRVLFQSVYELDDDDRHRLGMRRVSIEGAADYVVVLGIPLESLDEELASLRWIVAYIVPVALIIAGFGGWFIAVRDQGPGVPEEVRPHLFERFFRGDAARQRGPTPHDGAGLGLALARWIARGHDGDVDLVRSSESGSTFVIALPSDTEP